MRDTARVISRPPGPAVRGGTDLIIELLADHKSWTLFAMCFALFMIMLDNTIVNVALPSIQRELQRRPATSSGR